MGKLMRPIVIKGYLDQGRLDRLRTLLDLTRSGRLDDSEDVDFGTHVLRKGAGENVWLSLQRDDAFGWPGGYCSSPIFRFELSYEGEQPSMEMIDSWRSQILQAIEDVGLLVAEGQKQAGNIRRKRGTSRI